MAVAKDIISVFCSAWTRGKWVEAIAIRDCSITTSPPRIRPRPANRSGVWAKDARSSDDWKASNARSIIRQPAPTKRLFPNRIMAGSYERAEVSETGEWGSIWRECVTAAGRTAGSGRETNSGSITAAARALSSARLTPSRERSAGSLPKPARLPPPSAGVRRTTRSPMPWDSVDLGSSTPLLGMWEV